MGLLPVKEKDEPSFSFNCSNVKIKTGTHQNNIILFPENNKINLEKTLQAGATGSICWRGDGPGQRIPI